jgi:ankyrin repeat protein
MATGLDDMTPLHDAASFGNQKLVKMLIEKGADPLFKNKKGKSPQDIAHPSLVGFFRSTIGKLRYVTINYALQTKKNGMIIINQYDDCFI